MKVCLECFKKSPEENPWDFYNRTEIRYVKLSDTQHDCDICKHRVPIITQAIYKVMNPYGDNPPRGWIDIDANE